jgi:putative ABC transport system permease protein
MIKNYLTIALRTLWKNKIFSIINILGLSIGISASLVIYLLTNYHFSFDKFEKDRDRIYRVTSNFIFSGEVYKNSGVTSPMPAAIKKDLTGFDAVVPFRTANDDMKISVPPSNNKEPQVFKHQGDIVFADEKFFDLLGYEWVGGSPKTALIKPYQTVLTTSGAALYFPKLKPSQVIGKQLYFNDSIRTTVTGVVKDFTENTDFAFKVFISRITLETTSLKPNDWTEWGSTTSASQLFVKLSEGNPVKRAEKAIDGLYKKYKPNDPDDHSTSSYRLQRLSDIHFNSDYNTFSKPQASKPTLYGLLAVAAFLLLLGCINFINLTTAQTVQRAKEIGIRKTMGGSRKQLIIQFLSEAFLLTLIATILSVVLIPLILKAFSGFIPDDLHFSLIMQPAIILFLITITIAVTLLSGFYPALVLSGYKPVLVLKNVAYANTAQTRKAWLRKTLTVSQFVIAQVFVMGAILVSKQINYSINKDQGFKKEAILYFNTSFYDTVKNRKYVLLGKIRNIPEVAMVSLCTSPPSSNSTWTSTMKYKDGKKEIETDVQQKYGDTNYIKLYGLHLVAGSNIPQSDTANTFIINETYAHILGFQKPQDAIGKYIGYDNKRQFPVCGVVADFNQHSLHEPIKPLVITSGSDNERNISIALYPQNKEGAWKTAIAKIEKAWKAMYPGEDFNYSFFDEDIAKYYDAEQHISSLLKWATGLAVFISCLGLLGLVIYITNQRTKEIGVRKVLGASVSRIVAMITYDFIKLVLLAFIIATPLAWMGMYKWLEDFAFRTSISWWIFASGGAAMVLIALITLSFQTIKTAMMNPVKSLRTE